MVELSDISKIKKAAIGIAATRELYFVVVQL